MKDRITIRFPKNQAVEIRKNLDEIAESKGVKINKLIVDMIMKLIKNR